MTSLQKSDGSFSKNDCDTATVLNDIFASVFAAETDDNRPPLSLIAPVSRLTSFEITTADVYPAFGE